MKGRVPLDDLTSDALDQLYAERDAWAAKAEERLRRVLKQSRLLQELKRDNFALRMDLFSLLDGRLGDIGPSDIEPGAVRRAALDEQQEKPAEAPARARCRCRHARDLHTGDDCAGCTRDGLGILANHAFIATPEQT
ncbi:hypothetical protein ACGF1Z_31310 [Streptomyces sp. NPDC048018]|uniref:hypothetical protein n=1 Tax=Streptomyces sp. NPDC048018 TaxID=3365499 RepID=UPI003718FC43